jgi:predicted lipoprotein with Yx(FWY)xxD motif
MSVLDRRLLHGGALAGSAIAVLLVAAACSSTGNGKASAGGNAAGTAVGGTVAAAAGPASGAASQATVTVHSGPLGSYLADGSGRALYMFASDGANASSCSGVCLTYWPALGGAGKPTAARGVAAGQLASFTRAGGAGQVSYAGHPLYHFALDKAAGDTKGQGLDNFGGKWWLLAPSGQPITGASSAGTSQAPSSSAASSSGGGGGYGGGYGG